MIYTGCNCCACCSAIVRTDCCSSAAPHRVILLRQQPHLHSRATTIATRQVQPAVSPAPLPPAVMSRGISSIAVCKVHIYGCCIGGGSWVIESSKSFTTPASRAGEAAGGDDGKVAEFARSPVTRALTAVEVRVDQTPAILLLFAGLRLRPETKMKIISQNSHSRFKIQETSSLVSSFRPTPTRSRREHYNVQRHVAGSNDCANYYLFVGDTDFIINKYRRT